MDKKNSIKIGKCTLTKTGLIFEKDTTTEEWNKIGKILGIISKIKNGKKIKKKK